MGEFEIRNWRGAVNSRKAPRFSAVRSFALRVISHEASASWSLSATILPGTDPICRTEDRTSDSAMTSPAGHRHYGRHVWAG